MVIGTHHFANIGGAFFDMNLYGYTGMAQLPDNIGCTGGDYVTFDIYELTALEGWVDERDELDFIEFVVDDGAQTQRGLYIAAGTQEYTTSSVTFVDNVMVENGYTLQTALEHGGLCFRVPTSTIDLHTPFTGCEADCTAKVCGPDPVCGAPCGFCQAGDYCNFNGSECL